MKKRRETVLITGATSGIGFALAKCFRRAGYYLVLVSSSEERLRRASEELLESVTGVRNGVEVLCQDLRMPDAAEKIDRQLKKRKIAVDILVNNAGVGLIGEAAANDIKKLDEMLQVNVQAVTQLSALFLRSMYQRGSGKILNVASVGAFQPGPYTAAYYASKAYVASYSRAVRCEAAKKGVQVCTLYPGTTRTDFFWRAGKKTPFGAMSADRVARIAYAGLMKNQEIIVPGILNRFFRLIPVGIKVKAVAVLKRNQTKTKK